MQQQEVNTGTRDVTYDLVSVLYHALQGAENYSIYAQDATSESRDDEFSRFFRDLVQEERRRADRAKELLRKQLNHDF